MDEQKSTKEIKALLAVLYAGVVFVVGGCYLGYYESRRSCNPFPKISEVQQGYIAPSTLEIKCENLDGDGQKETIMKVGERNYLLKEVDGKPTLVPYEVKVVEK